MNVLIERVIRGSWERCEVGTFLAEAMSHAHTDGFDGLCTGIAIANIDQEPTPAARNAAVAFAQANGFDVLVMVDCDMGPHLDFLRLALHQIRMYPGCVVGSPYCGTPPRRLVQVMDKSHSGEREVYRVPREDAAVRRGIEQVACVGTGLIACDLRAFKLLKPPYFEYTYTSQEQTLVDDTEDFVFTRKLIAAGGKVFCTWNAWSAHFKEEAVGKPEIEDK